MIVKVCKAHQNIVIDWRKNKTFLVQSIHEHLPSAVIDGHFSSNALSLGGLQTIKMVKYRIHDTLAVMTEQPNIIMIVIICKVPPKYCYREGKE